MGHFMILSCDTWKDGEHHIWVKSNAFRWSTFLRGDLLKSKLVMVFSSIIPGEVFWSQPISLQIKGTSLDK